MSEIPNLLKVALINFHFAQNYGAVLQSLALQDRLSAMGCDVQVVDYRPRGHWQQYAVRPNPIFSAWWKWRGARDAGDRRILAFRKALLRAAGAIRAWSQTTTRRARLQQFEDFTSSNVHLTRRYSSLRELRASSPEADLYIAGSDQIWNPVNTGGIDPAYYLAFGRRSTVRATYAASPCQLVPGRHQSRLRELCENVDFLSLREADMKAELERVAERDFQVVADPVLLMTPEEWRPYMSSLDIGDPYILIYAVRTPETFPLIVKAVEEVRRRTNFRVVDFSLDDCQWPFPASRPEERSPGSFVSLIAGASYVVSNSFHATTFSVLFKRDFVVVTEPATSARLDELLDSLELKNRAISRESSLIPKIAIDYADVQGKLELLRSHGLTYLREIVAAA